MKRTHVDIPAFDRDGNPIMLDIPILEEQIKKPEIVGKYGTISGRYEVKKIMLNGDYTTVLWADGTHTVVKCMDGDTKDDYSAFTAALAKKVYGSTSAVKRIVGKAELIRKKGKRSLGGFCKGDVVRAHRPDKENGRNPGWLDAMDDIDEKVGVVTNVDNCTIRVKFSSTCAWHFLPEWLTHVEHDFREGDEVMLIRPIDARVYHTREGDHLQWLDNFDEFDGKRGKITCLNSSGYSVKTTFSDDYNVDINWLMHAF